MSDQIEIEVEGLEKLLSKLHKFPAKIRGTFIAAGRGTAFRVILPTKGLQNYPPETAANQPPSPFYIRGRGTQTKSRNYFNSENIGKQWYVKAEGFTTRISNRASYARYVHGEEQAKAMHKIGWRQLFKTAKRKRRDITKVYNAWVAKTLRDLGL